MTMITLMEIFYAFGVLFVSCELIDQFNWYRLPAEIQQMLPLIINFAQLPVDIKCFGSVACDREMFKYVSVS